ncbi:unnamed protein product [Arctogadus glacialis]
MGLSTQPCGVPMFVMMLAEVLFPILTDWGLPVRKSWSQSQMVVCRPSVDSLLMGEGIVENSSDSIRGGPVGPVIWKPRSRSLEEEWRGAHNPRCLKSSPKRINEFIV